MDIFLTLMGAANLSVLGDLWHICLSFKGEEGWLPIQTCAKMILTTEIISNILFS